MNDPDAEKIQSVFLAALELPSEDREAWLADKCGTNVGLLAEVQSLLKYSTSIRDPLEQNLDEVIADIPQMGEFPETRDPTAVENLEDVDVERFLSKLSEVGVLSENEFASVSDSVASANSSADPRQLASQLVTQGKLTSYQATALLKGEPDLLIDKYLILDLIDVGGMGMVFKAVHRTMNRIVALKMIPQQMLNSEDQVRRFKREVCVAATLEHPNIVRAYDADEAHGVNFLVMEYVRGENLNKFVRTSGPLSLNKAIDCLRQAAVGLQHAHERGIIHRDIKPGNLLLDDRGNVKLLDLGLAHIDESIRNTSSQEDVANADSDGRFVSSSDLTTAGAILGTASFMAPEQSLDTHLVDFRSDIYSLGCTLYFLLTGEVPYTGNTIFKVFMQHREAEIPSLKEKRPDVPDSIAAIFQKMVAKTPDDRFQTVAELLMAINDCHIPIPVSKRELRQPEDHRSGEEPQQPKKRFLLWTVGALIVVGMIAALIWHDGNGRSGPIHDEPIPVVKKENSHDKTNGAQYLANALSHSAADLIASGDWQWKITRHLGPAVNSPTFEFGADMTADGLTLVVASLRDQSPRGNRDLWIVERGARNEPWSTPVRLPPEINTNSKEEHPQISANGLKLSFRRGAKWYLSKRESLSTPWQEAMPDPVAFGHKRDYRLTPDELTAFRPKVIVKDKRITRANGSLMIWRRNSLDETFLEFTEEVLPDVKPIRTWGTLSNNGRMYIYPQEIDSDDKPKNVVSRLFVSYRPDWETPWSKPTQLFPEDSYASFTPQLLRDGRTLLLASNRPGGYGGIDIWMAELVPIIQKKEQ